MPLWANRVLHSHPSSSGSRSWPNSTSPGRKVKSSLAGRRLKVAEVAVAPSRRLGRGGMLVTVQPESGDGLGERRQEADRIAHANLASAASRRSGSGCSRASASRPDGLRMGGPVLRQGSPARRVRSATWAPAASRGTLRRSPASPTSRGSASRSGARAKHPDGQRPQLRRPATVAEESLDGLHRLRGTRIERREQHQPDDALIGIVQSVADRGGAVMRMVQQQLVRFPPHSWIRMAWHRAPERSPRATRCRERSSTRMFRWTYQGAWLSRAAAGIAAASPIADQQP